MRQGSNLQILPAFPPCQVCLPNVHTLWHQLWRLSGHHTFSPNQLAAPREVLASLNQSPAYICKLGRHHREPALNSSFYPQSLNLLQLLTLLLSMSRFMLTSRLIEDILDVFFQQRTRLPVDMCR